MKKVKILIGVVILSAITSMTVFAAEWKQNNNGWWYQEDNGSYALNCWKEIKGNWYYFNQDGYMLTNATTPDGYHVGSDGAWVQDISYIYEIKKNEIQNLVNVSEEECEFYIQDLNVDGIEELIAFIGLSSTRTVRVWTCSNGKIKELSVPDSELPTIWLEKGLLCFGSIGHSSHETYQYYKLNSNYTFEFITGVTWENGAYNGLGHDTYYIVNESLNHVREINKKLYEDILSR